MQEIIIKRSEPYLNKNPHSGTFNKKVFEAVTFINNKLTSLHKVFTYDQTKHARSNVIVAETDNNGLTTFRTATTTEIINIINEINRLGFNKDFEPRDILQNQLTNEMRNDKIMSII